MRTKLTLTAAFVALTFGQAAFAANQNLSTDVLVVGAGSAGLTAAVQAAEKGKKVILLEKNLGVGGSSQFAEGLFAVGSEWNRLRSDPLTKEEAFKTLMEKHGYVIDAAKTKDYVEGSAENISWLAGHGIKFEVVRMTPWEAATWHVISDYKGTNHGAGLIKGLKDAADKAGVETKLGTPATELILNKEGAVVGAKAADEKAIPTPSAQKPSFLRPAVSATILKKSKTGRIAILKAGRVLFLSAKPVTASSWQPKPVQRWEMFRSFSILAPKAKASNS